MMHRIAARVVVVVAILVAGASVPPVSAQGANQVAFVSEDATHDAAEYARAFGVSSAEAANRLEMSEAIGALEAELEANKPGTFAGLWVQNEPDFKVVLVVTGQGLGAAARYIPSSLSGLVEVRTAAVSVADLVTAAEDIRAVGDVVPFDVRVNVPANRVEVFVPYPGGTRDGVELPDNAAIPDGWDSLPLQAVRRIHEAEVPVTVLGVKNTSRPAAYIYGGLWLTPDCTTGFSVRDAWGTKGVTTAGHCPDSVSYGGKNLPYQAGRYDTSYDVQWNRADTQFTVMNWAQDMIPGGSTPYYRVITATTSRNSMYLGQWVCKYGRTTGYGCGQIISKTFAPGYVPNASPTFIQLHQNGVDLASGGDSGGPFFYGGTAFGTMSGAAGANNIDDAIFMAANYVSSGLSTYIMTSP